MSEHFFHHHSALPSRRSPSGVSAAGRQGAPLRGTLISFFQSLALRLVVLEPLKFAMMALLPQRLFERAAHSR